MNDFDLTPKGYLEYKRDLTKKEVDIAEVLGVTISFLLIGAVALVAIIAF